MILIAKKIIKQFLKMTWEAFDFVLRCCFVPGKARLALRDCAKRVKGYIHRGMHCCIRLFNKPERACNCKKILGRKVYSQQRQRILVDVSILVHTNAKSGIQRVVIRLLDEMLENKKFTFLPVARLGSTIYRVEYHQDDCSFHICEKLKIRSRDIVLMLDSSWDNYDGFIPFFNKLHAVKGKVYQVIYDLIPILQSQFSIEQIVRIFEPMMQSAIQNVDGMICISQTVATQLQEYILKKSLPRYAYPLKIGHFVLGADFIDAGDSKPSSLVNDVLTVCRNKKKFISVSTIEPRKNYDFMLSVVEKLWAKGYDIAYWIVGKHGWMVDDLVERIQKHPELNKRLFWFSACDDATLQTLYKQADVLLNLSHGEGYGLSLVEGAHYQCSIIASDIPVFREVITDNTTLFCNIDSLDETVKAIIQKLDENQFTPSQARYYMWSDSLKQLVDVIECDIWDYKIS